LWGQTMMGSLKRVAACSNKAGIWISVAPPGGRALAYGLPDPQTLSAPGLVSPKPPPQQKKP
jgi:hypothetical protein